jgi:hypothetical protein
MEIRGINSSFFNKDISKSNKLESKKTDFKSQLVDKAEISEEAKMLSAGKIDLEAIKKKVAEGFYNQKDIIRKTAESLAKKI